MNRFLPARRFRGLTLIEALLFLGLAAFVIIGAVADACGCFAASQASLFVAVGMLLSSTLAPCVPNYRVFENWIHLWLGF